MSELIELRLRPDLTVRKESIVSLALPERKNPVKVQITRIFTKDNDVFIEAVKCCTKFVGTHDSRVYRDFGTLIKF